MHVQYSCCAAISCQLSQDRRTEVRKQLANQGRTGCLSRVALYVALYGRRVGLHDFDAPRELLQVLEARRPGGIAAQRLAYRLGELRRLRSFHADQRYARLPVLEPDLDAIGGVRVDHDAVLLPYASDGRDAVGMGA